MGLHRHKKGSLRKRFAAASRKKVAAVALLGALLFGGGAVGVGNVLPHPRAYGNDPIGDILTTFQAGRDLVRGEVDITQYLTEEQEQLFKNEASREDLLTALRSIRTAVDDARSDPTTTDEQRRDLNTLDEALDLVIPVVENRGIVPLSDVLDNRDIGDRADDYVRAVSGLVEDPTGPFAVAIASNPEALDAFQDILPPLIQAFVHDADEIMVDVTQYLSPEQAKLFEDPAERENLLGALESLRGAIDEARDNPRTKPERLETLEAVDEMIRLLTPIVENEGSISLADLTKNVRDLRNVDRYQAAIEALIEDPNAFTRTLRSHPGALDALDDVLPQILRAFASEQADHTVDVTQYLSDDQAALIATEQDRQDFITAARGIQQTLREAQNNPATTAEQREKMASVDEMFTVIIPIVEAGGEAPLSYLAAHLGSLEKINQYKDDIQYLLDNPMTIAPGLLANPETLQAAQRMLPKILVAFNIELTEGNPLTAFLGAAATPAPVPAPTPTPTPPAGPQPG